MKIKAISKIRNYRNISNLTISFNEDINFILGENNVGKTNILDLFNAFFNEKRFKRTDFFDRNLPIEIEITMDDGTILTGFQKDIDANLEYNVDSLDLFNFYFLEIPPRLKEEECINKIYKLINNYVHSQDKQHFIEKDGKKILPLYILIDEPENHLHPYRQRSLIKKIAAILEDESIPYFGMRQIFVVTHSPNILLRNYKQFIRVYKEKGDVHIISGADIPLDNTKLYKHMLHNFIYLKEAMFSKKIIFVEGDTENGAFPVLASRMGIDFDELGVGVVKLDGAESVLKCMRLYEKFGIFSVAILDRDKFEKYGDKKNIYFTEGIDFEEDIYDHFHLQDYLYFLKELGGLEHYIYILKNEGLNIQSRSFLKNPVIEISEKKSSYIMKKYKEEQLRYLREKKNALKGALLCQYVSNIPSSYKLVIEQATKKDE